MSAGRFAILVDAIWLAFLLVASAASGVAHPLWFVVLGWVLAGATGLWWANRQAPLSSEEWSEPPVWFASMIAVLLGPTLAALELHDRRPGN